jgi:hypothetical protein
MRRKISMNITVEQLIEAIKQLTPDELEKLKLAITREELVKRSIEVKHGEYLKLDELESLKNAVVR